MRREAQGPGLELAVHGMMIVSVSACHGFGICPPHPMTTPLSIRIPHQLGRAEARRRIEAGFAKLIQQLPGGGGGYSERWDGDRLTFSLSAMGQAVSGVVDVSDAAVAMDLQLPSVLGMLASGLAGRIQKAGQLLLATK